MRVQVVIGADVYEVEVDSPSAEIVERLRLGLSASNADQSLLPRLPPSSHASDTEKEAKLCRSPLAGIVARVHIAAGEQVQPGDLMIVLEAMKMETNICAPAALTAKLVKVMPGDVVKPDQILLEYE